MDLQETRQVIGNNSLNFVRNTPRYALIFKTFTGSGKTTTVLNKIDEAGMRWIYVAPFHEVIEQNISRSTLRNFDFLHLEGRERCCLRDDLKPLIKKGININGFCVQCNFKQHTCPYYKNQHQAYTRLPNLAVTHAHIQTFLPQFLNTGAGEESSIRDFYDVMIIDENPIQCFLHQKQMSRKDIRYMRDILALTNMPERLITLMDYLYNTTINYQELYRLGINELNAHRINKLFSERVAELYTRGDIVEIPENVLPFIFEVFSSSNRLEDMIYYRKGYLNMVYFTPNALNLGLRIIGLDGTANRDIWGAMLDSDDFDIIQIDYQYKNAFQLAGGKYPITSWTRKDSTVPEMLTKIIDEIAEDKERSVLVVGTKSINRLIAKHSTSMNLMYAHYYNLRSHNDFYLKCDTVILANEPNVPPESLNSYEALSGWDRELWVTMTREEEMLQAVGRIRQNISYIPDLDISRSKIEVYIFPSTGMIVRKNGNVVQPSKDDPLNTYDYTKTYTPTLLPEAVALSKNRLRRFLSGGIDIEKHVTIVDDLLGNCPMTESSMTKKYGRAKTRKYFKYLKARYLIKYNRSTKKYDITDRGYKKLTSEEKTDRGSDIIYLTEPRKSSESSSS